MTSESKKSARGAEAGVERPDLTAWRWRQALRSSSAAQPVTNKRRYRRGVKHRKQHGD
ncbi:hypothetical protein ACTD5D_29795 [Nocardia takedensis]|uniref:hypothetical protein n=1 Tax=Nocardia takedensis TaxID=259390 RepID=UPI0002E4E39A|nr:hypothetical protein [Nocardia takedensis]